MTENSNNNQKPRSTSNQIKDNFQKPNQLNNINNNKNTNNKAYDDYMIDKKTNNNTQRPKSAKENSNVGRSNQTTINTTNNNSPLNNRNNQRKNNSKSASNSNYQEYENYNNRQQAHRFNNQKHEVEPNNVKKPQTELQQQQLLMQNDVQHEHPKRYSSMRNQRNNNINTNTGEIKTENQNKDLNKNINNNQVISYPNSHLTNAKQQQISHHSNKNIQLPQQHQQHQFVNQTTYYEAANNWQIPQQSGRPIVGGTQVQVHPHQHQLAYNQPLSHQIQHQIIASPTATHQQIASPQLVQPQYYYLPADYANQFTAQQPTNHIYYAQAPANNTHQTIITHSQQRPSKAIPIVNPEVS